MVSVEPPDTMRPELSHCPAARSNAEVFWLYPGVHAVWWYRLANKLWRRRFFFLARAISHARRRCRWRTPAVVCHHSR